MATIKYVIKKCVTCAFYQAEEDPVTGYCVRYPPQMVVDNENSVLSSFPPVHHDQGCGEHVPQIIKTEE